MVRRFSFPYSVSHLIYPPAVCIVTKLWNGRPGFHARQGHRLFSYPQIRFGFWVPHIYNRPIQTAESLRKRPAADRLLGLRVRIPPGYECVSYECCVLPGRGPSQGPITHPEESYLLWYVIVCDLETSRTRRPWPALGSCAREKKIYYVNMLPLFLAVKLPERKDD